MKNSFFTQILLLSIIFSCHTQPPIKATLVAIKPIATSSDKPIDSLFISYDKRFLPHLSDWRKLVVTDKVTFRSLESYILNSKANAQTSSQARLEDGIFELDVYDDAHLVTSFKIKSHQTSKQYLNDLINMLDENNLDNKLIEELRTLFTRINY